MSVFEAGLATLAVHLTLLMGGLVVLIVMHALEWATTEDRAWLAVVITYWAGLTPLTVAVGAVVAS